MSAGVGALVLVVEDDDQVRRFLRTSLPAAGFRVLEASSGAEALRLAPQYVPDVVLLDLGLPDMEGAEVAKDLRRWCAAPILVLSARGQEREKVALLEAGADDYLTKPFGFEELVARIRANLRRRARAAGASDGAFECGPLRVDPAAHRVSVGGEEVHLTPIEFKLLAVLAANANRIVTRNQLLLQVWGPGSTAQTPYLRVYMTHLRRKLERGGAARLIRTEAGVGYGLECPDPPANR